MLAKEKCSVKHEVNTDLKEHQQFSAGQFADMMQVDRHQLDYFDEIGLFEPRSRNKNGQKHYDITQVDQLLSILTSLDLDNDAAVTRSRVISQASHLDQLKEQQQLVEQQLTALGDLQRQLAQAITGYETARRVIKDEATVVTRPPVNLLTTDVPEGIANIETVIAQQIKHVLQSSVNRPGRLTIGRIHALHQIERGDETTISTIYTPLLPTSKLVADFQQPAGNYLVLYHDRAKSLLEGFKQLNSFAAAHKMPIVGDYYEEPVTPNTTRLLVQVRKNK